MIKDGQRAGLEPSEQHLSVMAHSMGCFHAFEALHVAASDTSQGLTPTADGGRSLAHDYGSEIVAGVFGVLAAAVGGSLARRKTRAS